MRGNMLADVSHRKEFKTRLLNRVVTSLQAPVEPKFNETTILLLPHNYDKMSEAELHNKLVYTVDLEHSPDSVLLTLDILFGRVNKPDYVQFQIIKVEKGCDQASKKLVGAESDKPAKNESYERETLKRQTLKTDLLEKVKATTSKKPNVQDGIEPKLLTVKVPSNYLSLSSEELYGILVAENLLTPEQAHDLFATLGGREAKIKFNIVLDPEIGTKKDAEKPLPKKVKVILPQQFKVLKVTDQYAYLVRQLALAPEEANDVIDILKGKPPISSVVFEIEEGS